MQSTGLQLCSSMRRACWHVACAACIAAVRAPQHLPLMTCDCLPRSILFQRGVYPPESFQVRRHMQLHT